MFLANLFAGICLLLFGVDILNAELQELAGSRFRNFLTRYTSNSFKGILAGTLVTGIVQSSNVVAAVLVALVNSGIMTLPQSIAVILGAGIGGTVTNQLMAFQVMDYALLIIGIGLVFKFVGKTTIWGAAGKIILGIGFVFYSIHVMSHSLETLGHNELFRQVLKALVQNPVYGILIATMFTALIQSSAVTIGIAMALGAQGLLSLEESFSIVLGATMGVTATGLISAFRASKDAKRLAIVNGICRLAGVLIVLPIIHPLAEWAIRIPGDITRQIANINTLFNVGIAGVFCAFTGRLAKFSRRLIPDDVDSKTELVTKYLDRSLLDKPDLAMTEATRETMRMEDRTEIMLRDSLDCFHSGDESKIEFLCKMDDQLDYLEHEIKIYLSELGRNRPLSEELSRKQFMILSVIMKLENIGDIVDKNLMDLARKKKRLGVAFSHDGWLEIQQLHQRVLENYKLSVAAFISQDKSIAQQVVHAKAEISQLERNLRQAHLSRLQTGLPESIETSEIHLDLLTHLKIIDGHIAAIAYAIID